jgi:capsular exopolysaccharide synthesis family protein
VSFDIVQRHIDLVAASARPRSTGYRAAVAQRMEPAATSRGSVREDSGEQPIELRRHLDAIRRGRRLIIALVVLMTGLALALSLVLPKSYVARSTVVYDPSVNPVANQDATSVQRELATISSLITTPAILSESAKKVHRSELDLEQHVSASVDTSSNIIGITARAPSAAEAARIANAVTETFIARQTLADRTRLEAARSNLQQAIARLRSSPNSSLEVQALQQRLSDIGVGEASAGQELQIAEAARPPRGPSSPQPIRNAVLAFFASVFIGILVALGRDQLVPRISGPRELSRITDRPVMAGIPFVRRRFGRQPKVLTAVEHEAYQTLQASLRFQLPADETHVVLVASALEGEGKTTVTANLGRALARAGRKTLIISADMRKPKLHELFDIGVAPGLSEVLTALERGDGDGSTRTLAAARGLLHAQAGAKGNLHILPSGKRPDDPSRLLLSPGLMRLFDELKQLDYDYVLVDGTPLLGLADSQALAQRVDDVLVVSRLDRVTIEDTIDLRDLLDRLEVSPLGYVVVGARRSVAYSYTTSEFEPA